MFRKESKNIARGITERERAWLNYEGSPVEMLSGTRLILDRNCEYSRKRFVYRESEGPEIELMRQQVHSGDFVIDVGANIGYWATLLSSAVGDDGCVFAFEPAPTTFTLLLKNLQINGCHNVQAFNLGISDRKNSGKLSFRETQTQQAFLHLDSSTITEWGGELIDIQLTSLDDLLPKINTDRLAFIKIDVEGHEIGVLRSAYELLRKSNPNLLIEYSYNSYKRFGVTFADLKSLCDELNYSIFSVPPVGQAASSSLKLVDESNLNQSSSENFILTRQQ